MHGQLNKPLIWTPICLSEGYVVRCGSKDFIQKRKKEKELCLEEVGLHAQIMITIIGSMVNVIKVTYMTIQ